MCPCCCRREQASCPLLGVRSARLLSVTLLWNCHRQAISCTFVFEMHPPYFLTNFARFSVFLYYFLSTFAVHGFLIMWRKSQLTFIRRIGSSIPYIQNLWTRSSGSPWHFGTDPDLRIRTSLLMDPDPYLFTNGSGFESGTRFWAGSGSCSFLVSDLQVANKNYFFSILFCLLLFEATFTSV